MMDPDRARAVLTGKCSLSDYLASVPGGEAILFAVSAQEGQHIPPQMIEAIRAYRQKIPTGIARESLDAILLSSRPSVLGKMREAGVMQSVLPELDAVFSLPQHNPHHVFTVGEHTLRVIQGVPPERILRWAALLHDSGKSRTHTADMYGVDHFHGHEEASARIAETVLTRLRFLQEEKDVIVRLVRYHDMRPSLSEAEGFLRALGRREAALLLQLQEADVRAQNPETVAPKLSYIAKIRALIPNR